MAKYQNETQYRIEVFVWLIIALSFLIGVFIVIANDFGEESEIAKRVEILERKIELLVPSQTTTKGTVSDVKKNPEKGGK